jgi:hypothetical protein
MEYRYKFKSDPNQTFQLTKEPFHSWLLDLYDIMQDQLFFVSDIKYALGVNGDEAMSIIFYAFFDLQCLTFRE